MSSRLVFFVFASLLVSLQGARAQNSGADDRIAFSLNGGTLTDTNGGAGGSLAWLHNFSADTLVGIAAEHQVLGSSHWTFGSLNGSVTRGEADARYSVYAEAHEGAGDDGPEAFHYHIEALGFVATFSRKISLQLEDRRIDVESTHGNLPKVGIAYVWNAHLQTTVAYQYSVSGNLGTRLTSARIDGYFRPVNVLVGGAWGQAAPSVLGFGFVLPPQQLHEGYIGLSHGLQPGRSELTLIADYQDLSGTHRATLTLNYIFHLRQKG
jgi:hypothetical protein